MKYQTQGLAYPYFVARPVFRANYGRRVGRNRLCFP